MTDTSADRAADPVLYELAEGIAELIQLDEYLAEGDPAARLVEDCHLRIIRQIIDYLLERRPNGFAVLPPNMLRRYATTLQERIDALVKERDATDAEWLAVLEQARHDASADEMPF